jgi:hypothetical protein
MADRLNLLSPEFRANPYPFLAELRRQPTLTQIDPGASGLSPASRTCPTALARLEPRVRGYAQEAAAALPLGQSVDFIADFALRVPAAVIGELLGLDASLHSRFKAWSDDILSVSAVPRRPTRGRRGSGPPTTRRSGTCEASSSSAAASRARTW